MRVLILSQYYKPEPVPKPEELAQELSKRGHAVAVLTGFPSYPTGKLYPGFRLALLKRETIDNIPVVRTFEFPYHGKQALWRFLNYFSFMASAPLGGWFAPPCDVIYVWHPPLTIGVAAWIIARLRRVPFVYDVQDIWPEAAVLSGMLKDGMLVRILSALEKFVYRRADHLLVVTDGARENLIAKGVPPAKVTTMAHWVDESLFTQVDEHSRLNLRREFGWDNRFVVLFAGNIGMVQGLDTVVLAAQQLQKEKDILIAFVGDGADKERLQNVVASLNLNDSVRFIERQSREKAAIFMGAADVLVVNLRRSELSRYVIPTKTLAYLAAGQPILMAMEGAAADLVQTAGAGIVIPPEDPALMAQSICCFYAMPATERAAMGKKGRDYLLSNFSKERIIPKYEEVLRQAIKQRSH